ncbi:MAG TPA: hypothetical protein VIA11_23340 [Acidimicrobiia bacterium]|jgi:hypothetical protein|nr:hypothetical protein [Acidimicrobiia bacterium]
MPSFDDTIAPSLLHPVSEVLTRYLAMTAPARSSSGAAPRTPLSSQSPRDNRSAAIRAEELWDALGDFA